MSKRRKLTKRKIRAIRADESRREGNRAPITLAGRARRQIFAGKERESVVQKVMDLLRDWRLSPFENEAATHYGIRSGLCIAGNGWNASEAEASSLLAEAFRLLGHQRPDHNEAHWSYTVGPDYCSQCVGPMSEEDIAKGRRYCSADCAKKALLCRTHEDAWYRDNTAWAAYRMVLKDRGEKRTCMQCGDPFGVVRENAATKFCSEACAGAYRRINLPPRPCRNPACGKPFVPPSSNPDAMFCCRECRIESDSLAQFDCRCIVCNKLFPSHKPGSQFCGQPCRVTAHKVRSGKIRRISPPVFDYMITMAA